MNRWPFALAVGAIFAFAASRVPPNDPDLFWHLATARWMVEHAALARVDTFSSTAAGALLPQQQWLGQLVWWAAWSAGSWWGIIVLRSFSVLIVATLVVWLCLARHARPLAVLVALPGLLLSRLVWADRPELLGVVCFAAFLALLLAARDGHRAAAFALAPLMALWANLHGSFAVGVALLVSLAIDVALFAPERRRLILPASALAIVATVVNPDGLGVYAGPGWHFENPPRFLQEWATPDVTTPAGILFAVTLLGAFAAAIMGRGGTRWAAILVPLAFLGLTAVRHTPLFALAAAPYLAEVLPLGNRLGIFDASPQTRSGAAGQSPSPAPQLFLVAAIVLAGLATAPRAPDLHAFPVAAIDPLRRERGTLLNEYDWGGYLVWAAPEHPVFIDGRLRIFVGSVLDDYRAAMELHPNWRDVLDRRDVSLVLARPAQPLAVRLRIAGWLALVDDTDLVLLQRPR